MEEQITVLFKEYVMPGILGGFTIGFSIYFLSLGVSFAYKLLKS